MIRKATIKDIPAIYKLLSEFGSKGELLPRPLSELYDHLRDFSVFVNNKTDNVVGCCALQFCWEDLAEIRSLAVHPDHWKKTIGSQLVKYTLSEAASFKISKVFTLTYQPVFFQRYGFNVIDRAELPLKIWGECILCVKYPNCDETAMMKEINQE